MNHRAIIEKSLRTAPVGERSDVLRQSPASVDRDGGMFGAGVIRGVSAITRGEALGHGMWVDGEMLSQVADAVASKADGVKVRFTHPGLSSDGLGTLLGRFTGGEVVGEQVFGDLHFAKSAHATPDGDLAEYVMTLADETPDLFGTSIVFERDLGAEELMLATYADAKGQFVSPDPMNTGNLPHARLASLRAVDAVDSPAANPDGLFATDGADMLAEFSDLLGYALGVAPVAPAMPGWLPVHPDRLKAFCGRYMAANRLSISNLDLPAKDGKDSTTKTKKVMGLLKFLKLKGDDDDVTETLETVDPAELSEAQTAIEQLRTEHELEIGALQEQVAEHVATIDSLTVEVSTLKAAIAAKDEELAEARIVHDKQVADKAAEQLAAAGHPPIATAPDLSPEDEKAKEKDRINQLKGTEKLAAILTARHEKSE